MDAIDRAILNELRLNARISNRTLAEKVHLSPSAVRKKYDLYDNKISVGAEAAEGLEALRRQISAAGYTAVSERGDCVI